MSCFLVLSCTLWLMINWNQYFFTVPMRFLTMRNVRDRDGGIWHVFNIVAPALVTACLLVICFFPHLIVSRFDNIPCPTPRCSSPFNLFHLDNLALIVATVLIAGTIVSWARRLWNTMKNGPLPHPIKESTLQDRLDRAIATVNGLTDYRLPEVKIFTSQRPQCFTRGWLRPGIWISDSLVSEMNDDDLLVILAHEHCHVLRYDNLVSHVLTVVSELSWAHSGCRTLLKGWHERRELFCDEFSALVVASREKVASTLVKLAEVMMRHQSHPAHLIKGGVGTAFYCEDKPFLQTRVENLLFPRCRRDARPCVSTYRHKLRSFAIFGLCMFILVVTVSSLLAGSLTYMHCLFEEVFSLHCSTC